MLEGRADGEIFAAAEVPRSAAVRFGVDDEWDAKGSGDKFDGAVKVLPCGAGWGNVGLAEDI